MSRSRAVAKTLAFIALGSNLGEPLEHLRWARQSLERLGEVIASSSLYRTAPVGGPEGQPDYLNAVVALEPRTAEPEVLLEQLLGLEAQRGRERRVRWGARTLDLDLLTFSEEVTQSEYLTLPHPRMMERAFVLGPLCEVVREVNLAWRHPVTGEGACDALSHLPDKGVIRTDLFWT